MSEQTFGNAALQHWDELEAAAEARREERERLEHPVRIALARMIHDVMYVGAFDMEHECEAHDGADAIIAAFPAILDMKHVPMPPVMSAWERLAVCNHPIRVKLAQVIHDGMYVRSFDPERDVEAWDCADVVLSEFPELLK